MQPVVSQSMFENRQILLGHPIITTRTMEFETQQFHGVESKLTYTFPILMGLNGSMGPILSQFNPVHILKSCFFNINFNILPSTPTSSKWTSSIQVFKLNVSFITSAFASPHILRVMKSRRIRWAEYEMRMGGGWEMHAEFQLENWTKRHLSEDLGIDGRIILKRVLGK